eukprot:45807-Eustigmatos_ZCMA.PRE.1
MGPIGQAQRVDVRPGQGVMFNASEIFHRVTPQLGGDGCHRVVVVLPLYTDPRPSKVGRARRWVRQKLFGV